MRISFEKGAHMVEEMRDVKFLPGYQKIGCHMIFNINIDEKFTRKARFVAGSHTTDPLVSITYSSVFSRDIIRIAFMIYVLNDLDVFAANIGNAYLNSPCCEKILMKSRLAFGSQQGYVILIAIEQSG